MSVVIRCKAAVEAGFHKGRPRGPRHASSTAALDANGGDVHAVQQHARHANPATTIKYDDNRHDLSGAIATALAAVL